MTFKKLIKNIFTSNIEYIDGVSHRRIIMINSMLILSATVFYIFTYTHIMLTQNYLVAFLDFFTATASLMTLLFLRKNKNVKQAAFISVIILMSFMIMFIIENKNSHFGIIWSIFIPFLAISFNGKNVGIVLTLIFYTILFYLAFSGIGIWNEGSWALIDFIRLLFSSTVLTLIIYLSESAHEAADRELSRIRENEKKILEELKSQAITDGLTKMYNRRYFNEVGPKLLAVAQRQQYSIGFFILDIDYFKQYNDYYGHHQGDVALQKIAKELMNVIKREDDFVFRLGGEEFAGMIHLSDSCETEDWLSKLTQNIVDLDIEHLNSELELKKLTVSIGLCLTKVTQETTLDQLYKNADDALYKAKNSGRNKIVVNS